MYDKRFQSSDLIDFDINGLKNSTHKYFENSLKSMHLFQKLMGAMNCRQRLQKKKESSAERSEKIRYHQTKS